MQSSAHYINTDPRRRRVLSGFVLALVLLLVVGCTTASPTFVPQQAPTATTVPTQTPAPTSTEASTPLPAMPKPKDNAEQAAPEQPAGIDQPLASNTNLPMLVTLAQSIASSDDSNKSVIPLNKVFHFDPATQTLYLRPSIAIAPETTVLVALMTALQSQNQIEVIGNLYQIPPLDAAPVTIVDVDATSGKLVLSYANQEFELLPGQSRSFKESNPATGTVVTTVTHQGRLQSIEPLPAEPGARQ